MIKEKVIEAEHERLSHIFGDENVEIADSGVSGVYDVKIMVSGVPFIGQGNYDDVSNGNPQIYAIGIGKEKNLKKLFDLLNGIEEEKA